MQRMATVIRLDLNCQLMRIAENVEDSLIIFYIKSYHLSIIQIDTVLSLLISYYSVCLTFDKYDSEPEQAVSDTVTEEVWLPCDC